MICLLFAVGSAGQENRDVSQTDTAAEEVLKQNLLTTAGAQESDVLLFDYDDFDGDGKQEAFMLVGRTFDDYGMEKYDGRLYFAGADGSVSELEVQHDIYRMIDGKMDFGSRKYLFFYLDYCLTANISVIWTVEDGELMGDQRVIAARAGGIPRRISERRI